MSALAVLQTAPHDPFAASRGLFEQLPEFLRSEEAHTMTHSDMERDLEQRGRELMRSLYQAWLALQAPAEAEGDVVDASGQVRTRKREHDRKLKTLFGTVEVDRTGYGAEGEPSLHPLDGHLNLPLELYSHELRRRAAEEASKSSFEETVATLDRYTGTQVPKRQVEELVQRAAQDFDDFYEMRHLSACDAQAGREADGAREATGSILVLTSDAKGVAMHKQDLRPATRKKAEQQRPKLTTRLTRGEKPHRKRMATVTAVYTVAPYVRTPEQVFGELARQRTEDPPTDGVGPQPRPRPEFKRLTASLEHTTEPMLAEAFQEALSRDPNHQKTWAAVVDGNETQLSIFERLAKKHQRNVTIVLDIIHVLDYLWKAGHVFHPEASSDLEHWVLERLQNILQGRACHVAAGIRRSATKRRLPKKKRKPVDRCADYLLNHKRYLAYPNYLAAGLPIASGVIEGAARHLVGDRMGLTGARWRLPTAEAVLRLRALRSSEDFDDYWRFHEAQEHDRNHKNRYQDNTIPPIRFPAPPNLAIIQAHKD